MSQYAYREPLAKKFIPMIEFIDKSEFFIRFVVIPDTILAVVHVPNQKP